MLKVILPVVLLAAPLAAQLTPDQRVEDFQSLASVLARNYAPHSWKLEGVKFDLFNLTPWLTRVRAAQDDIEYLEICAQYLASLRDGHTGFSTGINFFANLGITVDVYDGKVLIDSINRGLYPQSQFGFDIGDELLRIDGRPVNQLVDEFSRLVSLGNPVSTRRYAADLLTFRPASELPRAVNTPDRSEIRVRRAISGEEEAYTLTWGKTGVPRRVINPQPRLSDPAAPDYMAFLNKLQNRRAPANHPLLSTEPDPVTGEPQLRRRILGWGSRTPTFVFPPEFNFERRLGASAAEFFTSGVFRYDGLRIGYLRIPSFPSSGAVLTIMDRELNYFRDNTDGLVVDMMRNSGGGCIAIDFAQRLIPYRFTFGGEHLLATQSNILFASSSLELARLFDAPQWVIDSYEFMLNALQEAARNERALTGALPSCGEPTNVFDPVPTAYTKPVIFLADEFSVSFADFFLAVIQDNQRGPVVGQRTAGLGGAIDFREYGGLAEAGASFTITLDARAQPVASPDFPTAPFIENIGVIPDIPLEYMTRENLMTQGRPFVEAFARIAAEHIRKTGN